MNQDHTLPGVDHIPHSADTLRLRELDTQLIAELQAKLPKQQTRPKAILIQQEYTAKDVQHLERLLNDRGTLFIPVISGNTVTIDGTDQPIFAVAATEINSTTPNHGEMASMLYLRDHIQTASVLMELYLNDPIIYKQEGKEGRALLMSALHLMSTPSQLERFKNIIKNGQASQEDWPHISFFFDDLEAKKANGWRNKQDTFQMLAYLVCDALERGYLYVSDLSTSHKTFLGSVAPLLQAVGFPNYESSGSWEENTAQRTSVMAIETALLNKIATLTDNTQELSFLRGHLTSREIRSLCDAGLHEIGRRLPHESPDYPRDSIKYREADAALAYVLMYGIPSLLAKAAIPIGPDKKVLAKNAIEELLLNELATLDDPLTGGMRRYHDDSYQRVNFHTNEMQSVISVIKRTVQQEAIDGQIDLDKKQSLRGQLMPPGREAAWTHPLGQLSAWAAKQSIAARGDSRPADAERYRTLSIQFLNRLLATITGESDYHAVLDTTGHYIVQKAPAAKLPECYVTYQAGDGTVFVVPSPHTPLNWSTAMLKEALGLLRIATVLQ